MPGGIYSFYAITRTPGGDKASACTLVLENFELEGNLGPALTSGVVAADMDLGAGDVGDEDGEEAVAEEAATPAGQTTSAATLAPPHYSSHDYSARQGTGVFSLFFSFDNVPGGHDVQVFVDAACTRRVPGRSSGLFALIARPVTVAVSSLPAGTYSFYARTQRPWDGEASACVLFLENYEIEEDIVAPIYGNMFPADMDLGVGDVQDGDDDEEAEVVVEAITPAP